MKNELQLEQMEEALQYMNDFSESFNRDEGCDMNDCMWHCLAFVGSKGSNFNETAARKVAKWYYGGQDTYGEFYGDRKEVQRLVNKYTSSRPAGSYSKDVVIFVYEVANDGQQRTNHAVIMYKNNYQSGLSYYVFDPQSNSRKYISFSYLEEHNFFIVSIN